MIKIENTEVCGWEAAIRGMRNPKNSWSKSDSYWGMLEDESPINPCDEPFFFLGENDLKLMKTLSKAGTDHRKFMRMITVYVDITAPLYWWKEFKTYRAGRKFGDDEPDIIDEGYLEYDIEMNSCSTMHKIAAKEFTLDDFSHEHLVEDAVRLLGDIVDCLNQARDVYNGYDKYVDEGKLDPEITSKKQVWWQMIQLLPSSYNQKRTVMLNYEVLANMYKSRKGHRLDEWKTILDWIETLPYAKELIIGE